MCGGVGGAGGGGSADRVTTGSTGGTGTTEAAAQDSTTIPPAIVQFYKVLGIPLPS